jgi:hypothetical protein
MSDDPPPGELMTPMMRRWRLEVGGGGGGERRWRRRSSRRSGGAAGNVEGDRCHGDNHRRDDYNDYANYGAGKDDTPLYDGWRKKIRRMGNDVRDNTFFSLSLFC